MCVRVFIWAQSLIPTQRCLEADIGKTLLFLQIPAACLAMF